MGSSNKGWFEEVWVPIQNNDPGDEQVEGHQVFKHIALEAKEIVEERGQSYGPPSENHACTADLWNAYLWRRGLLAFGEALDQEDVCVLNVLQKISRQANTRKRDNLVDILGFVINIDMLD